VLPDSGPYEERYRLTGHAALGLTVGLVSVGLGIIWQSPGLSAASIILAVPVIFAAIAVVLAMPGVIAIARRVIAFRADAVGITLGTVPDNLPALRHPAVFVPWADVEQIVLYLARSGARGSEAEVKYIAVHRREGALDLSLRRQQVRGRVVLATSSVAARRLTRRISGWRLDRERLAAVSAVLAPGIPIVEATEDAHGLGADA
jgi:hypothetical protein